MVGDVSCEKLPGRDAHLDASKNTPENRRSGFYRRFSLATVVADELVVRGDVTVFAGRLGGHREDGKRVWRGRGGREEIVGGGNRGGGVCHCYKMGM